MRRPKWLCWPRWLRIPRRWLPMIGFLILGLSTLTAIWQIQVSRAEGRRQTCAALANVQDGLNKVIDLSFQSDTAAPPPPSDLPPSVLRYLQQLGARNRVRIPQRVAELRKITAKIRCGPTPKPLVKR